MSVHLIPVGDIVTFSKGTVAALTAEAHSRIEGLFRQPYDLYYGLHKQDSLAEIRQRNRKQDRAPNLTAPLYLIAAEDDETAAAMLYPGTHGDILLDLRWHSAQLVKTLAYHITLLEQHINGLDEPAPRRPGNVDEIIKSFNISHLKKGQMKWVP